MGYNSDGPFSKPKPSKPEMMNLLRSVTGIATLCLQLVLNGEK